MTPIPDGYMADAQGKLVPKSMVKPQDILQDELVRDLAGSALSLHNELSAFKAAGLERVADFSELLAQEYGVTKGGAKGNMSLRSFDGQYEVQVSVNDYLSFGPELQAAKTLIDECVHRWSENADDKVKVLVDHAFQVNKAGRIDTGRVLSLRKVNIDDPEWQRAMQAISDAVRVTSSRTYFRLYECDPKTGQKRPISLDLAVV